MRRVAIVGSDIAGLAAAWHLARKARVTLYEAGRWFGGHTNTVDVTLDSLRAARQPAPRPPARGAQAPGAVRHAVLERAWHSGRALAGKLLAQAALDAA